MTDSELLREIHYRLGWALIWLFLITCNTCDVKIGHAEATGLLTPREIHETYLGKVGVDGDKAVVSGVAIEASAANNFYFDDYSDDAIVISDDESHSITFSVADMDRDVVLKIKKACDEDGKCMFIFASDYIKENYNEDDFVYEGAVYKEKQQVKPEVDEDEWDIVEIDIPKKRQPLLWDIVLSLMAILGSFLIGGLMLHFYDCLEE